MKLKRIACLVCAVCLSVSALGTMATAAATDGSVDTFQDRPIMELAYMDLESAPSALKDDILAARAEIIFGNQSWTVDGAVSIINLEDGTVTKLPEFSDLFPGWEIPDTDMISMDIMPYAQNASIDESTQVFLEVASDYAKSEKFFSFTGTGGEVGAFAERTPADGIRYNLGFGNASTGKDLGWVASLKEGEGAKISTKSTIHYEIRASVSKSAYRGTYGMRVTNDPDIIGDFYLPEL